MIKIRKPNKNEEQLKKKVLKDVAGARARMLIHHAFTGLIAMKLELIIVVDSRLPTACTDGTRIFFNANYFNNLRQAEKIYLVAHEVWHCVFQHFKRRQDREPNRFNYAADLEIDFMLGNEGFKVIDILPHKESWKGLSAEEIYERLDENADRGAGVDIHIYEDTELIDPSEFAGAADDEDVEQKEQKGSDNNKQEGSGNATDIIIDNDYQPSISPRTERRMREWVINASQHIKRIQGKTPAWLQELIEDRFEPQISWKDILLEFVTSCFGGSRKWLPPNRRYAHQGLYLPSRKDEFLTVTVAIDTSGSTMADLPAFLAELKGIVESFGRYEIKMIECDMVIQNVRTYSEWDPFEHEQVMFHGFGGTDFRPVFDYVAREAEEPRLLVYLTDGYGEAPEHPPKYDVLWVLTSDGEPPAEWGRVAYLTSNSVV
jgi:predicted metal-dependent peptidase